MIEGKTEVLRPVRVELVADSVDGVSNLGEATPAGDGWERVEWRGPPPPPNARFFSAWRRGRCFVISTLDFAELPTGKGIGLQWQISISHHRERPGPKEVRRALIAFNMVGAEEDNHHPGIARHFFMPVDPAHRVDCECKTTEEVRREPDGYTWTNPRPESGEKCRGCEISALTLKACPIHLPGSGA